MFEKMKVRIWSRRLRKKTGQAVSLGVFKSDDRKKEAFDAWAQRCAEKMEPNAHSIEEVEGWLTANYRTEPLAFSEGRLKLLTADTVRNFFPQALKTQVTPPKDDSYREFERWHMESEQAHQEAMQADPAALGLQFFGCRVLLGADANIEVVFERKSGQISIQGACPGTAENPSAMRPLVDKLSCGLTKQRGVTQEDIDGKTPRFLGYITTLRDAGEPGFEMENGQN